MTAPTIEARWVAAGIGLPPVWRCVANDGLPDFFKTHGDGPDAPHPGDMVDPADHQTRAGLLRQLAMWAGDDDENAHRGYALKMLRADGAYLMFVDQTGSGFCRDDQGLPVCFNAPGIRPGRPTEALARIVEAIGMDHHIRRALGWEVEPGTLATLEYRQPEALWALCCGERSTDFSATLRANRLYESRPFRMHTPALEGVTDEHEARRVIAEAL